MPELPEIITITRDLKKELLGKRVTRVKTFNNYPLTPSTQHFRDFILGHTLTEVGNIAKLITLKFSSQKYLAIHLNMSGILLFNTKDPYIKVSLHFEDNNVLNFSDVRMFGYFEIWDTEKILNYKKNHGKEALDETLTPEEFVKVLKKKNIAIKTALLDQKLVSGIGNIYANDALFLSKINPLSKTGEIPELKLYDLYNHMRMLLEEGISHRGSSIDRYRDIYGQKGTQQNYFRVYGKNSQKCPECKTPIEFVRLQGRGTFYCPKCQA